MALSTSRTLITKTGISTTQVFDMGGINIAGGDFNLGSAIKLGNASGIITATKFVGPIEGAITSTDATFTGDVSIVGIITARSGIRVGANGIKRETVHLDAGDSGANYLRFTNTTTGNGTTDGFNVGINADENALLWNFENKDTIFATNNLERLRIKTDGNIGIGTTLPNVGGFNADAKVLTLSGTKRGVIELRGDIPAADTIGAISFLSANNNKAEIKSVTDGSFNGDLRLATGGSDRLKLSSSSTIFNEDGADVDFRIEGDTQANLFYVDASADAIGVGATPGTSGMKMEISRSTTDAFVNASDCVLRLLNTDTSANTNQTSLQFTTGTTSVGADSAIVSQAEDQNGNSRLEFWTDTTNGMTEKASIDSTGDLTIKDGDLVIGTSGHGIDFSATGDGNGTMQNELLDDYEEGLWTPTGPSGVADYQFANSAGYYTKIGNIVWWFVHTTTSLVPNNNNVYEIHGLPYTSAATNHNYGWANNIVYTASSNNTIIANMRPLVQRAASYVYFHTVGQGTSARVTNSQFRTGMQGQTMIMAGNYQAG